MGRLGRRNLQGWPPIKYHPASIQSSRSGQWDAGPGNSHLGQNRASAHATVMSALPPTSRHRQADLACLKGVESRCDAVALGSSISVAAPFVRRCLTGSTMAPFSHPAHR